MMKYRAPQLYGMQDTKAVCSNGTGTGPYTWETKCGDGATPDSNDCNVGLSASGESVSPASACQTNGGSDSNFTSCCGDGNGNNGFEYETCTLGCGAVS